MHDSSVLVLRRIHTLTSFAARRGKMTKAIQLLLSEFVDSRQGVSKWIVFTFVLEERLVPLAREKTQFVLRAFVAWMTCARMRSL